MLSRKFENLRDYYLVPTCPPTLRNSFDISVLVIGFETFQNINLQCPHHFPLTY